MWATLSDSHTTLQDACVCMSAYVCMAIYQNYQLNKRKFQICTRAKANSCSVEVDTMDPSLSNYTPSDAMNVTLDHDRQGQGAQRRHRKIEMAA